MREHSLKRWLVAASLALAMPGVSSAAGLGRLTVLSALGQPLNAEVELISPTKGETLSAKLSSIENYQRANLPFNAALVNARVTVERRPNGTPYVKVTTARPVNEPFAELLIEINSENGRVTRQYTVLLDPPGYGRSAGEIPPPSIAAPTVRSAPAVDSSAAAAPGAPLEGASGPAAAPAPRSAPAPASRGGRRRGGGAAAPTSESGAAAEAAPAGGRQYGPVKPGETLGRIAKSVQPEGVTLEQTLVGLYRHNPDAFIKKNMNLVKSGRILKVPEANEMAAVAQPEARREVRLQVTDFNSFRGSLADRAGAASDEGSVASGRIGRRVAKGGAAESRDTVRLSRGEGAKGAKGNAAERVRALEEESVAREKALSDANARISQLEKTIQDMKRLADMKGGAGAPPDKAGAVPPQAGKGPATGPVAVAPVIPPPPAKAPEPAAKGAAPGKAPEPAPAAKGAAPKGPEPIPGKGPEAIARAPGPVPGVTPEVSKGVTPEAPKAPPTGVKGGPADTAKAPGPVAKSDLPPPKPKAKAPPQAAPEPDLLDTIMDEPLYLVAGAGVLVLGGLGLIAVARRRRGGSGRDEPMFAPSTTPSGPTDSPDRGKRAAAAAAAGIPAEAAISTASPGAKTGSLSPEDNDLDFNANVRSASARAEPTATPARRAEPAAAPPRVAEPARAELKPPESAVRTEIRRDEPVKREPVARNDAARSAEPPAHVEPAPRAGAPAVRPSATGLGAARALEGGAKPPETAAPLRGAAAPQSSPAPQRAPEPAPPAPKADSAVPDLPDFSLEVPPAGAPAESQSQSQGARPATPAAADFNMDFNLEPLPPIEMPGDQKPAAPAPAAAQSNDLEFKLDDISLDFGSKTPAGGSAGKAPKDDHWYDVQQKFDLAKAYEEMGDKDGARDILQEVLKEGDSEQQTQAKKLLATLG